LNINGTFVLTMSKKSYFLEWGCPPLMAFTAVPLTSQHPLEKNTCCYVIENSETHWKTSVGLCACPQNNCAI
jgi:hypothetical protein